MRDLPAIKVESAEVLALRMPLRGDFATSFGRVAHREMLVLRLRGEGLEGFGEAPVALRPHYSPETTRTAWHVLADWMLPAAVGRRLDIPALRDAIAFVRGHHMARAALEWALLDLQARAAGLPLAGALGAVRARVPVGVSLGIPSERTPEALVEEVRARVEEGYARVKVKVERGFLDAPLRAVRRAFPDLRLAADANGAFDVADADALAPLDDLGLIYLEQPIAPYDLVRHARLKERLRTPICLDESIEGRWDLEAALALSALDILNLKPGRVGGPTAALDLLSRCREAAVPVWIGGMLETGIGRAACVALAACPGVDLEADLSASDRYYEEDLVDPPFVLGEGSTLAVPDGPGLGVTIIEDRLARVAVERTTVRAAGSA